MIIYRKDDIEIGTIEERDIDAVLTLYNENDFGVKYMDTMPTVEQFESVIREDINEPTKQNTVLVLRKRNLTIGYASIYISGEQINLGTIAITPEERNRGYGCLLTYLTTLIASKGGRKTTLVSYRPQSYLRPLGFTTTDGISFICDVKPVPDGIPNLFVSNEEHQKRELERINRSLKSFESFLDSDLSQMINNL